MILTTKQTPYTSSEKYKDRPESCPGWSFCRFFWKYHEISFIFTCMFVLFCMTCHKEDSGDFSSGAPLVRKYRISQSCKHQKWLGTRRLSSVKKIRILPGTDHATLRVKMPLEEMSMPRGTELSIQRLGVLVYCKDSVQPLWRFRKPLPYPWKQTVVHRKPRQILFLLASSIHRFYMIWILTGGCNTSSSPPRHLLDLSDVVSELQLFCSVSQRVFSEKSLPAARRRVECLAVGICLQLLRRCFHYNWKRRIYRKLPSHRKK